MSKIENLQERFGRVLIVSGPLTSRDLSRALEQMLGTRHLAFYDAIAPVLTADSVDTRIAFRASHYGKGAGVYLNCPMNREHSETFVNAVREAEKFKLHAFEEIRPFEGCLRSK